MNDNESKSIELTSWKHHLKLIQLKACSEWTHNTCKIR